MLSYLIRRLGYAVVMVILVSFVSFVIIELPPGDFLDQKLAQLRARGDRSAEARIDDYRIRYGLDRPFMERYTNWAVNFVKGDFGESFEFERPVRDLLGERLTMTVILALASLIITWAIAIPSYVAVPRPISSKIINDLFVARFNMFAVSTISTINVDCPAARLSDAPTRENN